MSTSPQGHDDINQSCPECGSSHIVIDNNVGERVCSQCGYVLGEVFMDRTPEWRAFNVQEQNTRSRVGLPTSLAVSDKGLHTSFGNIYRDTKGKVSTERKWQLLRLSKWQRRVSGNSNQRNLNKAMSTLARLVSHLNISRQVQEQAAHIYRKALQKELVKGRSIENVMSASLYAACRMTKTQRTLSEIAEYISGDKMEIAKTYRLIYNELDLSVPRPNARNRIPKIASRANIPQNIQLLASELLRKAEKEKITAGKDPNGLAAAALYIVCIQEDQKFTQKDIAFAAGVTEVTIRNRYKGIVESLEIIL
ncbi:MAG: transcription initiation factor IIB [Candidatus Bathyarchaeota archaeon]|nr:transcription initiation factor IIB [Candidatus Bathyarchaeota archaeon]